MSQITVLYGTESGNAEMVADDLAAALEAAGWDASVVDLTDVDPEALPASTAVVISSTYNEGDLPASAEPFYTALTSSAADLQGFRFAAFGLGDSTYANYNQGIETLRQALIARGAEQIGETGRHDAASGVPANERALAWLATVLQTASTL